MMIVGITFNTCVIGVITEMLLLGDVGQLKW